MPNNPITNEEITALVNTDALDQLMATTKLSPEEFINDRQVRDTVTALVRFPDLYCHGFKGIAFKEQADGQFTIDRPDATSYICMTFGIGKMDSGYNKQMTALEDKFTEPARKVFEEKLEEIKADLLSQASGLTQS